MKAIAAVLAIAALLLTGCEKEDSCDAPEGYTCIVFSDGPVPK